MTGLLIALGGSIGTGKTTLAYRLKKHIEDKIRTECFVLESDTVRREYFGHPLKHRMTADEYTPAVNTIIYGLLDERTIAYLRDGACVIRCLTGKIEDFAEPIELAATTDASFIGLFLQASEKTILERLAKRENERIHNDNLSIEQGHASDADAGVLLKYPILDVIPPGWIALDAEQPPEKVCEEAVKAIIP